MASTVLEEWCDEVEITERARQHITHLQRGTYHSASAFHLTEALAFTKHIPQIFNMSFRKYSSLSHTD